jgi:hypothetical protein
MHAENGGGDIQSRGFEQEIFPMTWAVLISLGVHVKKFMLGGKFYEWNLKVT